MKSSAFRIGAIIAGMLVTTPIVAGATTLVAPMIMSQGETFMVCVATNGGTSPGHVVITAYDQSGAVISGFNFCGSGDLAPGASCYQTVPNNTRATCSFQVSGKIRAAAEALDVGTGRPVFAVPATK
jgi:hypothetical protein